VESDGLSISGSEDESTSFDVPLIVETPRRKRKSVSFVFQANGHVQCSVREIQPIKNADLWWNQQECESILQDCAKVVRFYQGRRRICTDVTDFLLFRWIEGFRAHPLDAILNFLKEQHPDVLGRGLEQHIVGSIKHYVDRHRMAVLMAQDAFVGTDLEDSFEAWQEIHKAAETTSQDCKNLARRVALLDELAAFSDDDGAEEKYV
jgi:hypothetical protein